jgi:hypothetical protein
MADSTDTGESDEVGPVLSSLSRRALFGLVVAQWSAGSLSETEVLRLYYGWYRYGQFVYGGD